MLNYSQSDDMHGGRAYPRVTINIIISTVIESRRKQSRMLSWEALLGAGDFCSGHATVRYFILLMFLSLYNLDSSGAS